jgi:hypothetical protein
MIPQKEVLERIEGTLHERNPDKFPMMFDEVPLPFCSQFQFPPSPHFSPFLVDCAPNPIFS